MINVFTSNIDGGIVQFAIQLTTELQSNGIPCRCFIPDDAIGVVPGEVSHNVIQYKKIKVVSQKDKRLKKLSEILTKNEPILIWYVDSSILSSELCSLLSRESNRTYKQLLTVHDPAQDHPTNRLTLRDKLKRFLVHKKRNEAFRQSDKIVTLSPESGRLFELIYPKYSEKNIIFNLGAHIPNVEERMPREFIQFDTSFLLFFGRIDRYKGIENLLQAFSNRKNRHERLVIAGRGSFTEAEETLIKTTDNVIVLKRYIDDEEQIWLFKHAKSLILPYIEASQSGIIPIAYKFGVPVIVSNIPGLTQFVEDRRTGIVCNNVPEITEAIDNIDDYSDDMKTACINYYKKNMDWKESIQNMLISLNYKGEDRNE